MGFELGRISLYQYLKRWFDLVASALTLVVASFFFFQAEDGIRDLTVTGVQTCALPISRTAGPGSRAAAWGCRRPRPRAAFPASRTTGSRASRGPWPRRAGRTSGRTEIGRASCRERV